MVGLVKIWFLMIYLAVPVLNDWTMPRAFQNQLGEYYTISNHPKAKGVNLKIKVPKGWEIKEGDRPNIVVKFVNGADNFIVQVNEAPTFISKSQARELFSDAEYKRGLVEEYNSIFNDVRILGERIVTVDNYPALEFELTGTMERVGTVMNFRMKIWQICYEDKFIILQGGTFGGGNYQSMLNFFTDISNSVILPDQYSTP